MGYQGSERPKRLGRSPGILPLRHKVLGRLAQGTVIRDHPSLLKSNQRAALVCGVGGALGPKKSTAVENRREIAVAAVEMLMA